MTVLRYAPTRSYNTMQDTMNSLVNALFNSDLNTDGTEFTPRMDMKEDENALTVKLMMPGLDPDAIEISVNENILTVKGQTAAEAESGSDKDIWHAREIQSMSFYRAVRLPVAIESDKAEADYTNGILTLVMPKAEEEKPKTIKISSKK